MKKEIYNVCAECGITANVLTCLKKYGRPPKTLCFTCSTYHMGKCDYCGEKKSITETRDFFYPDFSLIKKTSKLLTKVK
jgi:hypothetical protein